MSRSGSLYGALAAAKRAEGSPAVPVDPDLTTSVLLIGLS